MPRRTHAPRGNLRPQQRSAQASFGARHPISYRHVRDYLNDLDSAWADILPGRETTDLWANARVHEQFRIYNDPDKIGLTVLEKRLSAEHSRRHRITWQPHDIGRIRGRMADAIARLGLSEDDLKVTLSHAERVGDPRNPGKIALLPEAGERASGFLIAEHEIIVNGLGGVLKGFRYPYDDYTPKLTVGRVFRDVEPDRVDACVQAAQSLLPLTVQLEPIVFFADQQL